MAKPKTVTEYISAAPKESRAKLKEMRALLKKVAPKATEAVKWGAPTFSYTRILFAYAAYKKHVSLMPTPPVLKAFAKESKGYTTSKASIRFSLDKPLPRGLITKMAKYRVKESKEKDVRWM